MTEANEFFQSCWDIENKNPVIKSYSFGNDTVKVEYGNDALKTYFHRAIAHLQSSAKGENLHIRIMTGKKLPIPFWDWSSLDSRGNLSHNCVYKISFEHWHGIFRIYNPQENQAFIHVESLENLPIWYKSFPFRTIVDWYFQNTPLQPAHAACVQGETGSTLIIGKGGSGKSTTALACLKAGYGYLGDDFVLTNSRSGEVFSLYNVAKIDGKSQKFFQDLGDFTNATSDGEKVQIYLQEILPDNVQTKSSKLKAILLPRIANQKVTKFHPITSQKVLQALAPSTIELLKTDGKSAFRRMANLCRLVPGYEMELSNNMEEIPLAINQLLSRI